MGNCFSDQGQNINKMALQQVQQVIKQHQQKNIQLLIVGPEQSGRKTFINVFQPDEQQDQFLGSKSFQTLSQGYIRATTYQMDGILKSFQNTNSVIFLISGQQIEQYNSIVKQSIISALQQEQIQKVLVIISHVDKYHVLAKYFVEHDTEDCEYKNKLCIIESNLLIMENVIEGLEWIFGDLSSN